MTIAECRIKYTSMKNNEKQWKITTFIDFFSKKKHIFSLSTLDIPRQLSYNTQTIRREVEQLAARRAHNPEAAGSSPALAILKALV